MSEVVQDGAGNFSSVFTIIKTEKISDEELLSVYNTDFRLNQLNNPGGDIPAPAKNDPNKKRQNNNKSSIYYNNTELNINFDCGTTLLNLDTQKSFKTSSRYKWNESPEARIWSNCRQRRLLRNAARMREKRAQETPEEYRARLKKNAEANRMRRQNETEVQRAIRLMKNAERQRLKRANETPEERAKRLKKSAERMRNIRAQMPKIIKPNLADRLIGF